VGSRWISSALGALETATLATAQALALALAALGTGALAAATATLGKTTLLGSASTHGSAPLFSSTNELTANSFAANFAVPAFANGAATSWAAAAALAMFAGSAQSHRHHAPPFLRRRLRRTPFNVPLYPRTFISAPAGKSSARTARAAAALDLKQRSRADHDAPDLLPEDRGMKQ
jgi:hypothetical protein